MTDLRGAFQFKGMHAFFTKMSIADAPIDKAHALDVPQSKKNEDTQKSTLSSDVPVPMDAQVFRQIYETEFRPIWHTLRRFGVPEKDLDDASHEVFVVLHRRYADFDQSRSIRSWLMGIAYRTASDFRKRASARYEIIENKEDDSQNKVLQTPGNQDVTVEEKRRKSLVHQALLHLDDERRTVFVLHELEGYSIPEIVDLLEQAQKPVPLNTLYSRLRLAREAFTAAIRQLQKAEQSAAQKILQAQLREEQK